MIAWVSTNIGNIAVTLALLVIVAAVIFKLIKDKKNGRSSCGGDCAHCGMCDLCKNTGHPGE